MRTLCGPSGPHGSVRVRRRKKTGDLDPRFDPSTIPARYPDQSLTHLADVLARAVIER
jgi:hypothetical protein